jgi:transcriptional regulator with XRE-family HTH domain
MASGAHEELRQRYERGEFTAKGLADRVGCTVGAIRFVLSGTVPKVTLALRLERELGIPVSAWTTGEEETT